MKNIADCARNIAYCMEIITDGSDFCIQCGRIAQNYAYIRLQVIVHSRLFICSMHWTCKTLPGYLDFNASLGKCYSEIRLQFYERIQTISTAPFNWSMHSERAYIVSVELLNDNTKVNSECLTTATSRRIHLVFMCFFLQKIANWIRIIKRKCFGFAVNEKIVEKKN